MLIIKQNVAQCRSNFEVPLTFTTLWAISADKISRQGFSGTQNPASRDAQIMVRTPKNSRVRRTHVFFLLDYY